ncbi:uncharacterized protein LOC130679461 [Manis pentadactyla]|uniref:uncharacterized protein LOC130679461 n=1 Tax=Manis pentadactyla TaxID=143292 RepID=UPI00255CC2CE|nr:uncharacterized protein LOC130679461 [Manis pentadactyla]
MHLCAVHRPYGCTQRSWQHLSACVLTSEQVVSSQSVFRLIELPPPHYACPWVGASLLSPWSKTATSACSVACLCGCMVSGFLCHALFPSSSAPVRNGSTSLAYCHLFSAYLLDCITSIPLLSFPCSFMREEMSPYIQYPILNRKSQLSLLTIVFGSLPCCLVCELALRPAGAMSILPGCGLLSAFVNAVPGEGRGLNGMQLCLNASIKKQILCPTPLSTPCPPKLKSPASLQASVSRVIQFLGFLCCSHFVLEASSPPWDFPANKQGALLVGCWELSKHFLLAKPGLGRWAPTKLGTREDT